LLKWWVVQSVSLSPTQQNNGGLTTGAGPEERVALVRFRFFFGDFSLLSVVPVVPVVPVVLSSWTVSCAAMAASVAARLALLNLHKVEHS
jgi:hypothetical protein